MKITEVRIFPTKSKDGRLKAYATMTFDDWFVVRNVKIIEGNNGFFVAMPSRKIMHPCKRCGFKNAHGSKFCNDCGAPLDKTHTHAGHDHGDKRQGEHVDIAHPIRQECRVYIQETIIGEFSKEMKRKEKEGEAYKPASEEDFDAALNKFADPNAGGNKGQTDPERPAKPKAPEMDAHSDIEL